MKIKIYVGLLPRYEDNDTEFISNSFVHRHGQMIRFDRTPLYALLMRLRMK